MEIFYCDTCGKRASEEDRRNSLTVSSDRIICRDCLAKIPKTKTEPTVKAIAAGSTATVTARRSAKAEAPPRGGIARISASANAAVPANNKQTLYIVGGVAAVLVVGLLFAFVGGGDSKTKKDTAKSGTETSKVQAASSSTLPAPLPGLSPALLDPRTNPAAKTTETAAAKTEPRELSPKELYEQKVREGKIKTGPAAAEPAFKGDLLAIATPPANDPSWKNLLNGKDLTGWETPKGTWKVENGITICTPNPQIGGSFVSSEVVKDFELLIKFKCSFQAEWYWRGGGGSYYLDLRDNPDWRIFRMVGKDRAIQASLDGKVLEAHTSENSEGTFSAYIHQASSVYQIAECKVRELRPDELKPAPVAQAPLKELFNGKDLTGWNQTKGKWRWEDGALLNEPGETPCRIESEASYGNCELSFKVKLEAGHHIEVQVLNYQWFFEIGRGLATDFKECKIVIQGTKPTCTLAGNDLDPRTEAANTTNETSGAIGFYSPKGGKVILKDLSIRPLK
ncbi:MAG: DUF1080 domain-containing protein [Planctomycetes bacterium]|nr:DUF1080 domain-containing protein [Planctomycetota bacterium]